MSIPEHIAETLERWRFNLALECSGASLNELESIAIGGAVLKLRDLHEALEWLSAQGTEAGTAETGTGSVHDGPVVEDHAPNVDPQDESAVPAGEASNA